MPYYACVDLILWLVFVLFSDYCSLRYDFTYFVVQIIYSIYSSYDGYERLNVVEVFDVKSRQWKKVTPMIAKRRHAIHFSCHLQYFWKRGDMSLISVYQLIERM